MVAKWTKQKKELANDIIFKTINKMAGIKLR